MWYWIVGGIIFVIWGIYVAVCNAEESEPDTSGPSIDDPDDWPTDPLGYCERHYEKDINIFE